MRRLYRKAVHTLLQASKVLSRGGLYRFLEDEFARIEAGRSVLSIGAGGGTGEQLTNAAQEQGFTVTELDVRPEMEPDIVADICEWAEAEAYDVVVVSEVLEHLHSPRAAVRNMYESLRPGGRLVLTIPFLFPIHGKPHDYVRYTKHGLRSLLDAFDDVRVQERNSWSETLCVLLARTVRTPSRRLTLLSFLFVPAAFALYPLAWGVGKAAPMDFMTTAYHVTARKPSPPDAPGSPS